MTIKIKCYSALLLTASTSLVGCQSIEIVAPQTTPQDRPIMIMKADIPDSDGDGVFDDIDECPQTPTNVVTDERGCPISVDILEGHFYGGILPFPMNSSQPSATTLKTLKGFANVDEECIIILSGHISKYEDTERNKTLAKNRVEFVKNYIIMNYQVNPKQIETAHYGSERSKASSESYEDSKIDQRVDVRMEYNDNCRKPLSMNNK
ncbi:OmpA family protein [Psychrobacter sp. M13]|uniref:OmpA family protein n=1 Tax=Psychrobacter sp. M13 TaxID=3067275 RepID=UPI00273B9E4D|nr:OmpA family protein [Psychrobacter sp. M13]WLP95198.1 OmpA family protein [Psychrobacter sp. M13]